MKQISYCLFSTLFYFPVLVPIGKITGVILILSQILTRLV